ncbi:MAG: glycosyltransferase family 2 protein [Myxococcota bacterium]
MTRARIMVVIPCRNVEPHVRAVLAGIPSFVERVVMVDDGSTDGTRAAIQGLGDPRVELVIHEKNRGIGAAMKSGYRRALELGADILVKMDGDEQMDPGQLPALLTPILAGRADYTKGNRFRDREALESMPLARRIGNIGLSFWAKLAAGYWHGFDPTNGYTAIRADVLRELVLESIADDYFFEISTLAELNVIGAAVEDVRMPARYGAETSSLRIRRVLLSFPPRMISAMLRRVLKKYFWYDFSVVALFLLAGLPITGFGIAVGAHFWLKSLRTGVPTTAGQVMLAGLPVLVGVELLLQALVADVNAPPAARLRPVYEGLPAAGPGAMPGA